MLFTRLPGASIVSCIQSRPLMGKSSICLASMTPPMLDCCKSTNGASPVTVTVSSTVATVMLKSSVPVCPTSSATCSWTNVANPDNAASTVYSPGRIAPIR